MTTSHCYDYCDINGSNFPRAKSILSLPWQHAQQHSAWQQPRGIFMWVGLWRWKPVRASAVCGRCYNTSLHAHIRDSVINREDLWKPLERNSSLGFMQRIDPWWYCAAGTVTMLPHSRHRRVTCIKIQRLKTRRVSIGSLVNVNRS